MIKKILCKIFFFNFFKYQINKIKINQSINLSENLDNKNLQNINDFNFSIFSQFNEDAIIQFLIRNLDIKKKFFIEFGVENYEEANTRLLLEKDNWQGLIIDSCEKNISYIKNQYYYWRHNLTALRHFVTVENINYILKKNNYTGDIGLLSIDTDGNDFWIWKEIKEIKPIILIIEYNAKLGNTKSLSIKYTSNFKRASRGLNKLIYGASLKALEKISKDKGYSLVCVNKNGNNAFFVRQDYLNRSIFEQSAEVCFKMSQFREYLDDSEQKQIDDELIFNHLIQSGKFIEV
jgi:hypothetical protein